MSALIKAYTDELDSVYNQIEILWAEADKDEYLCFTKDFTVQIKCKKCKIIDFDQ